MTECVHEHTEDCYPAESVSDNTDAQSLDLSGLSVQVNSTTIQVRLSQGKAAS